MEISNQNPLLLKYLVENNLFQEEPFVYFDVGCSGGVDDMWRLYGEQIQVHAFDPQQTEISRLNAQEKNPNIKYHPYYIGIVEKNEYSNDGDFCTQGPWQRSSAAMVAERNVDSKVQSNSINTNLSTRKISLDDFIEKLETEHGLNSVDFIKIDCDGGDLEALMSCQKNIASMKNVLGLMVECNYVGSANAFSNSFHNIDRILKSYGYQPFAMEVNKYSRAALPRPFMYDICAQTKSGPVVWGDVVFMLDGGALNFESVTERKLSNIKLLKLVSLFDLYDLQDCAAELLVNYRQQLEKVADVDHMLNLLTKEIAPNFPGYQAYIQAVTNNPSMLFPQKTSSHTMKDSSKKEIETKSEGLFKRLKKSLIG